MNGPHPGPEPDEELRDLHARPPGHEKVAQFVYDQHADEREHDGQQ